MLAVIMAGGVGERFWPLSQIERPKQFLNLTGKGSMIRLTVDRLHNISRPEEIFVVTNINQIEGIRHEVPEIPAGNIIVEPEKKNTAPCIGVACSIIRKRLGNQPVIVLPADHLIEDLAAFEQAVQAGERYVSKHDVLLTFGIKPSRPDTGYGYIRAGNRLAEVGNVGIFVSEEFLEKPDIHRARRFYKAGNYFWNSGMFMWKVDVILDAIARHLPGLASALSGIGDGTGDMDRVLKSVYGRITPESIDFGVMEKASNVVILKGDFYWNDVGSWESIRELFTPDEKDNVLVGEHVVIDGTGNTVLSSRKLVGMIGIDDAVIVVADNAILICKRKRVQEVKQIVNWRKSSGREDLI
ncbi:MAG: mannose-1-phosphate guanylyltransferase [Chitinivibrionia bacterium]|nr:mannose-1-phosphate guanylyltransferase [Chitinivibrionia bacterium]